MSCASELVGLGSPALAFSTCAGRTELVLDQHLVWNGHLISFLVFSGVIGSADFCHLAMTYQPVPFTVIQKVTSGNVKRH